MKRSKLSLLIALTLCSLFWCRAAHANVYAPSAQACIDQGYDRGVLQTAGPYEGMYRCLCNEAPHQLEVDSGIAAVLARPSLPSGLMTAVYAEREGDCERAHYQRGVLQIDGELKGRYRCMDDDAANLRRLDALVGLILSSPKVPPGIIVAQDPDEGRP